MKDEEPSTKKKKKEKKIIQLKTENRKQKTKTNIT